MYHSPRYRARIPKRFSSLAHKRGMDRMFAPRFPRFRHTRTRNPFWRKIADAYWIAMKRGEPKGDVHHELIGGLPLVKWRLYENTRRALGLSALYRRGPWAKEQPK